MSIELALALSRIGKPRVLVIGDFIYDTEFHCEPVRFAQEASHCPVYREVSHHFFRAGGAGAVDEMATALGADVMLIAPPNGAAQKTRFFVNGVQAMRFDKDACPLSTEQTERIAAHVADEVQRADCVLIADYGKGVCTDAVLRAAIDGAKARGIPCICDPVHGADWRKYHGATAMKCNKAEWQHWCSIVCNDDALRGKHYDPWHVVITHGHEGMSHFQGKLGEDFPCYARRAIDPTGCGDMVLAALGVCIAGGMSWSDACRVANSAAGLKVCRRGAVPIPRANVIVDLLEYERIGPAELLAPSAQATRNLGGKVVWANGCFDGGLHAGHLHLLTEAEKHGDVLIVGVNTDESVYSLKGPGRPIRKFAERAGMVAALACVDYVVGIESEIHLDGCIKAVAPDVLIKGSDWRDKPITGSEYAGRIHFLERLPGISTTEMIRRRMLPIVD